MPAAELLIPMQQEGGSSCQEWLCIAVSACLGSTGIVTE
jgi:hypothetical protein